MKKLVTKMKVVSAAFAAAGLMMAHGAQAAPTLTGGVWDAAENVDMNVFVTTVKGPAGGAMWPIHLSTGDFGTGIGGFTGGCTVGTACELMSWDVNTVLPIPSGPSSVVGTADTTNTEFFFQMALPVSFNGPEPDGLPGGGNDPGEILSWDYIPTPGTAAIQLCQDDNTGDGMRDCSDVVAGFEVMGGGTRDERVEIGGFSLQDIKIFASVIDGTLLPSYFTPDIAGMIGFSQTVAAVTVPNPSMDQLFLCVNNACTLSSESMVEFTIAPEPGTLALIGIGLVGLGAVRRRKTRR